MAKIFLESNDTFTQSSTNTGDTIFGGTGSETVILQGNPDGTLLDGNVEEVQVAGNAADTTLQVNAQGQLELTSGGTVYATFTGGLNAAVDLQFEDGNVTLKNTAGGVFTVEDPADDTDSATIDANTAQTGDAVTLGTDDSTAGDGDTGDTGAGDTLSLTTGIDDINAGSDDTVITALQTGVGTSETFQSFDSIDGEDGNDTLNITNTENAALNAAIVENVEVINYRSTSNNADIDMSNFTGETELTMDRTAGEADVTDLELATELTLSGLRANAVSIFTYLVSDVTGTADAGAVTMDGINDGAEVDFAGDIETFTVTTSGTDSRLDNFVLPNSVTGLTVNAAAGFRVDDTFTAEVETLTITGAGDVRISDALDNATTTVDASASTGNVTLEMGEADQTITTNTGDDVIDMEGNLDRNDTIDLGDGSDTLRINVDGQTAGTFDLNISNVETFRFDNTAANNGAINMDNLAPTAVQFDAATDPNQTATTGVVTLTDLTTAVTAFDLVGDGDATDSVAFNGITADYDVAGTTNVSSVTINVGNGGTTANDIFVNDLSLDNVEGLELNGSDIGGDAADELTVSDIIGNDLESIVVSANGEVIISDINTGSLEVLDLSGVAAGGATVSEISDNAAAFTITGSGFDDTIVTDVDTAGNDVTVDLGAGNDAYTSVDATDTITTGTGSDTITFKGNATDDDNVITDFTAGNGGDIIDFATNAASDTDTGGEISVNEFLSLNVADGDGTIAIEDGFTAVNGVDTAGSLSEADVATFLANITGDGGGDELVGYDDDEAAYIAVTDGTDTGIYLVTDSDGADAIVTGDLDLVVTLTGVDDTSTLTAANFADFL